MPRIVGDASGYSFHLKQANGRYNQEAVITLPSVTTVIKRTLAAPALLNWYYRQTVDSISGLVAVSKGFDDENVMSLQDILSDSACLDEWLGMNRMRPEDIGREAMDRGSNEHSTLENLANIDINEGAAAAREQAERLQANAKATGWQRGIADWWLSSYPHTVASEMVVFSLDPYGGYAGSLDLVADIDPDTPEGVHRGLIDLKTRGVDGRAYASDFIQVAAYKKAYEEMTGSTVDALYILVVRADGTWVMEKATIGFEAFAHLLAVDQILRRV